LAPPGGDSLSNFTKFFGITNSLYATVWCCLCDPAFSIFGRTPTFDRRTDGHRSTAYTALASVASRSNEKNVASPASRQRQFKEHVCGQAGPLAGKVLHHQLHGCTLGLFIATSRSAEDRRWKPVRPTVGVGSCGSESSLQ